MVQAFASVMVPAFDVVCKNLAEAFNRAIEQAGQRRHATAHPCAVEQLGRGAQLRSTGRFVQLATR
jgi:hypothetical protein